MAKELTQLKKTVSSLLKTLSPRNRDIISRRFGLASGRRETLEAIGTDYKITRERVRQIGEFTLNQLRKTAQSDANVAQYVTRARSILQKEGGVLRESDLFEAFSGKAEYDVNNAGLVFLLTLFHDVIKVDENDRYEAFWALSGQHVQGFQKSVDTFVAGLAKRGQVVGSDALNEFVAKAGIASSSSPAQLKHVVTISKDVGKNIFNEFGLASWSEIRPRGVRDKAFLILKKEAKPLHFTNIAGLIQKVGFGLNKKVNVQTVHNELIKDDRFVLVGRGLYALSEWGYKSGTVKDVLTDILSNSNVSLTRTQLISKVQDARMVKENTIILNLQDSRRFIKNDDGTYVLRKA